jgi:hypothetical protein
MILWENKSSKQKVLATEHWEPLTINFDEKFYADLDPLVKEMIGNRKIAHGCLCQVGWLLKNNKDVWFGMGLKAKDHFNDLGEATKDNAPEFEEFSPNQTSTGEK